MKHKKTTIFITALLALILCFSIGVSASPEIYYESDVRINVPELEPYLDFPDSSVVKASDVHAGSYYVAAVSWDPYGDQYVYPEKAYTVTVTVETEANHFFSDDVKAYINGNPATIVVKGAEQLKISYTFPKLKAPLPSMFFDDVKVTNWFYNSVEFVYYNHLMKGVSDKSFGPSVSTNRAMVVTVLYRMEGEPSVSEACPFTDVRAGSYYEDAVTWASKNKIVEGYGNGIYGPNDNITREQLACIFFRFAKFKGYYNDNDFAMLSGFSDRNTISSWAEDAASWAVGTGLVKGVQETNGLYFYPKNDAQRCQFAAILERFCDYFNYYD